MSKECTMALDYDCFLPPLNTSFLTQTRIYIILTKNMLGNVLKNYGSLTTMRILSRLLQFALKTYLIRTQLDEQILAHLLSLQLILTTSLHLVRSCLKPSYQKVENDINIIKSSMNIMTLGVGVTIISSVVVSGMQYYQYVSSGRNLVYFVETIALYAASAVCEAIAEKYMVQCTVKYEYLKVGMVEVASIVPKTLIILVAASVDLFSSYGILIFGVGNLLYSFTYMAIFFCISSNKAILLQEFQSNGKKLYLDPRSKETLKEFSILSLLKFILSEFQKIVLVVMDISHISSVYSLISNLGSMVVRYLYAPLNEIIFNYFSRGDQKESVQALINFIQCVAHFSVISVSFGFNFSEIFLTFLYGEKWVTDETIWALRTYMILVVFLGFNGIMEAFLFAKGKDTINKYNFLSIITTCIYLASTIAFLYGGFGASALFLGNIVNMFLRIIVCWNLQISRYIKLRELLVRIRPSFIFLIVSATVFFAGHKDYGFIQGIFHNIILKFLTGGALLAVNLFPILLSNRKELTTFVMSKLKPKKE